MAYDLVEAILSAMFSLSKPGLRPSERKFAQGVVVASRASGNRSSRTHRMMVSLSLGS